ncbi:MAG: von Willebrand factor type A domain-containing protein, partial [Pirellula sp.]
PSVNNFDSQVQVGKDAAVPAKPNEQSLGTLQDSSPQLALESSKLDNAYDFVEQNKNTNRAIVETIPMPSVSRVEAEQSYTVTGQVSVPDGGTIVLGGIKKLREEQSQSVGDLSTLMQTVTPRIMIPEEEEVQLFAKESELKQELGERKEHFRQLPDAEVKAQVGVTLNGSDLPMRYPTQEVWEESVVEKAKKLDGETERLNDASQTEWYRNGPGTTKYSSRGQGAANSDALRNEAVGKDAGLFWYEKRTKDANGNSSIGSESAEQEGRFGWKFTPAPSPEVAASSRGRVTEEGKPIAPKHVEAIDEQSATAEAFSTFSLHVSDVSFKLAQTALSQGQWPDAAKIRIEEFVNALDYHDPLPRGNQKVACRVEQAIHPFLMHRNLMRVSMRTAATGRSRNTPLRLTLLLDNSGSMERPDRRQAVLRAFQTLTSQLNAADQVTLISFASVPRLLAEKVPGNQGEALLQIIENLPSEGGTNIEAALLLAREKAAEHQVAGAQNRIVLLTDGAVNLGNANPDSLAKLITQMRDNGIAFDAAGISALDLNDEVLEALTRQGDGRYYLL